MSDRLKPTIALLGWVIAVAVVLEILKLAFLLSLDWYIRRQQYGNYALVSLMFVLTIPEQLASHEGRPVGVWAWLVFFWAGVIGNLVPAAGVYWLWSALTHRSRKRPQPRDAA
jgi:hypothetical protein